MILPLETVQAYPRDTEGSVPAHTKASCNLFGSGGSCPQFTKSVIPVKWNKAKCTETRYAWKYDFILFAFKILPTDILLTIFK